MQDEKLKLQLSEMCDKIINKELSKCLMGMKNIKLKYQKQIYDYFDEIDMLCYNLVDVVTGKKTFYRNEELLCDYYFQEYSKPNVYYRIIEHQGVYFNEMYKVKCVNPNDYILILTDEDLEVLNRKLEMFFELEKYYYKPCVLI